MQNFNLFLLVFESFKTVQCRRRHRRSKLTPETVSRLHLYLAVSLFVFPAKLTGVPDLFSTSRWVQSMHTTTSSVFAFGSGKTVPNLRRDRNFKFRADLMSTGNRCCFLQFVVSCFQLKFSLLFRRSVFRRAYTSTPCTVSDLFGPIRLTALSAC
jgi:hypothetical protein